jgi:hypothetical protein
MTKAEYQEYLKSPQWQAKRAWARERSGGVCERCYSRKAREVHHISYAHVGTEWPEDVADLCAECHDEVTRTGEDMAARREQEREIIQRTIQAAEENPNSGRMLLERTVLKWAVNDPAAAAEVFSFVEPAAFCTPGCRLIAEALVRQVEAGDTSPDRLAEEVAADTEAAEVIATILAEKPFEADKIEFAESIYAILAGARADTETLRWNPAPTSIDDLQPPESKDDVEALRAAITARLDAGEEISADDPRYQEYRRIMEARHGRHGTEYYGERRVSTSGSLDKLLERERRHRAEQTEEGKPT